MTRLRIMSDLHLEFGPLSLEPIDEDVLVLAGDIGIYDRGALWAIKYARRAEVPVVMIAGNHEFYRNYRQPDHTIHTTIARLRQLEAREPLFTFLEDDIACVSGVTFIGCTLWTDYALYGNVSEAKLAASFGMNDHEVIAYDNGEKFLPSRAEAIHQFSVGVLHERLPQRYVNGPLVIMTHHLPSARSIGDEYAGDPLNVAFASRLDDLVESSEAALWVHGHTHSSYDYHIGRTRVLCNPRGYYPDGLNSTFNPNLIMEV